MTDNLEGLASGIRDVENGNVHPAPEDYIKYLSRVEYNTAVLREISGIFAFLRRKQVNDKKEDY